MGHCWPAAPVARLKNTYHIISYHIIYIYIDTAHVLLVSVGLAPIIHVNQLNHDVTMAIAKVKLATFLHPRF